MAFVITLDGVTMGSTNYGARIVYEASAVFKQGARTKGGGLAGFATNLIDQFLWKHLQRTGK